MVIDPVSDRSIFLTIKIGNAQLDRVESYMKEKLISFIPLSYDTIDSYANKNWPGAQSKYIDSKYDWVLYLDCDAGLTGEWDNDEITSNINNWELLGYDMVATRTNAIVGQELKKHNPFINLSGAEVMLLPSYTGDVVAGLGA
jgi:hypothetical protein